MRRIIGRLSGLLIATVVVIPVLLSIPTQSAAATPTYCNDQTITNGVIVGDLIVPSGAYCDLYGSTVTGNATVDPRGGLLTNSSTCCTTMVDGSVTVQENGQFAGFGGSKVGGNIQCDQCKIADFQHSTVSGNLQDIALSKGAFIRGDTIGGSLEIVDSQGGRFGYHIETNSIGANLQFDNNHGTSVISSNTISGKLECSGNTPPPTGSGDVAAGGMEGQCATL
jgi:hypothetical protein